MAVYRRTRGGTWWVGFRLGGKYIRRSAATTEKQKAEEFEQSLRDRYWRAAKLGEQVHTWREAVERYGREAKWRKNTRDTNERALPYFAHINHLAVASINQDVVRAAREYVERSQGLASANRIMAVFRGVLRKCVKWGWLTHAPIVELPKPPERDPVWLTPEQCEKLVRELPQHTRAPMLFSVLTGLRMSNVRDLVWGRVDLERGMCWVPSSHYKTKKAHGVPLSEEAVRLLRMVPRVEGIDHVFTYTPHSKDGRFQPRPITGTFNTKAFRKARERAGVTVRWHDLRHTFASWLAMSGASDRVIQSLCGWSTPAMVQRYAHLRPEEMRSWASAVGTNAHTGLAALEAKTAEKPSEIMVPAEGIEPPTPSLRKLRLVKGVK